MLIILPILLFILLVACFRSGRVCLNDRTPLRSALLLSMIVLWVFVYGVSEVLSIGNHLTRSNAAITWIGACGLAAMVLARKPWSVLRSVARSFPVPEGRYERIAALVLGLLFCIEALRALVAPPNTWDSLTYHLPRVMHWIQNGTIGFYPTNILRQAYLGPGAELAIMHTVLLSGSDRFVNLVQFCSFLGCVIGVSAIANEFGCSRRAQGVALLFAATIPMALLQSTSTQNDLVLSMWVVCIALFLLKWRASHRGIHAAAAGAAIGLSILTKGTAFLIVPPLVLLVFAAHDSGEPLFSRVRLTRTLIHACAGALIAGIIIAPQTWRNYTVFHSPINPNEAVGHDFKVSNDRITYGIVAANIARNIGIHLGTPFKSLNRGLDTVFSRVLGPEINNPASTWIGSTFRIRVGFNEDVSGNTLHFLIILAAFFAIVSQGRVRRPLFVMYGGALVVAFLLVCLLLKWQPFHSRLHLPLFVLAAPLVATVSCSLLRNRFAIALQGLLLIGAFPWVLLNATRPLCGAQSIFTESREKQFFVNSPPNAPHYARLCDTIAVHNPRTIGLAFSEDIWEYPLWVFLKSRMSVLPLIEHVSVKNATSSCLPHIRVPDLIVTSSCLTECVIEGKVYGRAQTFGNFTVLFPQPRASLQP